MKPVCIQVRSNLTSEILDFVPFQRPLQRHFPAQYNATALLYLKYRGVDKENITIVSNGFMDDNCPNMASQIEQDSKNKYSNLKNTDKILENRFDLSENQNPGARYDSNLQKPVSVEKSGAVAELLDRMSDSLG